MFNKLVLSGVNLWVRVWLRAAQTETGNKCGGATKKRDISRTLSFINLHFSVGTVLCTAKEWALTSHDVLTPARVRT